MLWKSAGSTDKFIEVRGREELKKAVEAYGCEYTGMAKAYYATAADDGRWIEVYGLRKA
jgi:hypothetical protein